MELAETRSQARYRQPVVTEANGAEVSAQNIMPFISELRWLINGLVARAKNPNGTIRVVTRTEFADFEQQLRRLQERWEVREREVTNKELLLKSEFSRLEIQKRDQKAISDQLAAREQLVAVTRTPFPNSVQFTREAQAALEALRAKLDAQESDLRRLRTTLDERQRFLDEAETMLGRKIESQDAMAALLEQRAEDLDERERKLAEREKKLR